MNYCWIITNFNLSYTYIFMHCVLVITTAVYIFENKLELLYIFYINLNMSICYCSSVCVYISAWLKTIIKFLYGSGTDSMNSDLRIIQSVCALNVWSFISPFKIFDLCYFDLHIRSMFVVREEFEDLYIIEIVILCILLLYSIHHFSM